MDAQHEQLDGVGHGLGDGAPTAGDRGPPPEWRHGGDDAADSDWRERPADDAEQERGERRQCESRPASSPGSRAPLSVDDRRAARG